VTFQVGEDDSSAIRHITQLLEGMPLGLELAGTWVNTLSCQEIADEISRGLDILETSLGDISERQHSMRAVFDHSWNLLSGREQVLLSRLAVFRGSFSRQAAEQIAGISLRELSGFVDKSLVRRNSQGRFDLHDLLRQYCMEKLAQSPTDNQETCHRHCVFYSTRMSEWNEQLGSEKQGQALREIETELENILAAWDWAVHQRQCACTEQAVDGLCMFFMRRARFTEGLDACQKAIDAIEGVELQDEHVNQSRLAARLLAWQAIFCINLELFEKAKQLLQRSQEVLNDPVLNEQQVIHELIFGLVVQTLLAALQHEPALATCYYEQVFQLSLKTDGKVPTFWIFYWRFLMGGSVSKELYSQIERHLSDVRQSGDPFELGCHLYTLGIAELYHNYRTERAEPLLKESIKNFQLVDDPSTQAMIFKTLGYLLSVQGEFAESLALKKRELVIYQEIGDLRMMGIAHAEIGEIYCHQGDYPRAEEAIRSGIMFVQELSDYELALRHRYLGDVLLVQGNSEEAREAYQYSYQFFQSKHDPGWMLTAITGLSRTEFALGNKAGAKAYAIQALQLYGEIQLYTFFVYLTLAEIALLLADRGELLRALEVYGLVTRQGYLAQSAWFADLYGKPLGAMAEGLPMQEIDEAKKRGQAKDLRETVETLLAEFG
jgi:tetratricopeptide (TPR) repeat protein